MAEETSGSEQPLYTIRVNEAPKFDLTSYISNYRGRTVFRRLYLIASCATTLREEAARLAVIEAKKGSDIKNYNDAVALLKAVSSGKDIQGLIDSKWPIEQEKKNLAETKRMDNELRQYKNNLIRESIRMGSEDIGLHHHATGNLSEAIKAFSRMRDYCTTATHMANTAFRIIAVAIEQRAWLAVQSQVHKIRSIHGGQEEQAKNQPKTNAAMGLQQMSSGSYKEAALSFLGTDPSLGDSYNEIMTSNDVAVYGGLCALASMSRAELQSKVLDNADFRNFLELEPHIRRAIQSFCASKYSLCLEILESYRADYLLDIYLQPHLAHIYDKIRTKSIVQYFQPFSKVTLASMEQMFGQSNPPTASSTNTPSMLFQSELIKLISEERLNARIDLEQGVLVAKETDLRAQMQKEALETVDAFIREARLKLLRLNVINGGLEVKPPAKKKEGAMDINSMIDMNGSDMPGSLSGNFRGQGYSLRSTPS